MTVQGVDLAFGRVPRFGAANGRVLSVFSIVEIGRFFIDAN